MNTHGHLEMSFKAYRAFELLFKTNTVEICYFRANLDVDVNMDRERRKEVKSENWIIWERETENINDIVYEKTKKDRNKRYFNDWFCKPFSNYR